MSIRWPQGDLDLLVTVNHEDGLHRNEARIERYERLISSSGFWMNKKKPEKPETKNMIEDNIAKTMDRLTRDMCWNATRGNAVNSASAPSRFA